MGKLSTFLLTLALSTALYAKPSDEVKLIEPTATKDGSKNLGGYFISAGQFVFRVVAEENVKDIYKKLEVRVKKFVDTYNSIDVDAISREFAGELQRVEKIDSATEGFKDTIMYAKTLPKSYQVNEPIAVMMQLKRDAYIYFWTVAKSGKGYLILPNKFADIEQYKAQIEHTIPNDKALYQFVSDAKGKEKVYILATSKPIGVARISAIFHKESNQALRVASAKSMESFSKDMQVIAKEEKIEYAIKELEIEVN